MKSQFFRRPWSCNSASSHEVLQHISHIILFLSSILVFGGLCGSCPYLKIWLISSSGEQRWILEMVAPIEAAAVHLRLAAAAAPDPTIVPAWACNIFQ